jgi:hypothetical protein
LKTVMKKNIDGYLLLGDQLVDNQTLKAIDGELNGVNKHSEAIEILEKYGIKSQQTLEVLGYRVKWNGLDSDNAEIIKI